MKKTAALLITAFLACSLLSAKERLFSFSAGLSSGVPFYGSNSAISTGSEIEKGSSGNRCLYDSEIPGICSSCW